MLLQHLIFIFVFLLTSLSWGLDVQVSLNGQPSVRDLPATYEQDKVEEQAKRQMLIRKQQKIDARSFSVMKKKASLYYQKGRELFAAGNYALCQKYFAKAISLDASVDQYFHEYAIALFKNGNHRRSLALLGNLEGLNVSQVEVQYYSALNFFRLKQYEFAIPRFEETQSFEDPVLSPLAAMYLGITHSELKQYPQAKQSFQTVLDTSNDPALDNRAESYIEGIDRYLSFLEESKKKWAYSVFLGTSYDENVLNVAANNISTGVEAYRFLFGGSIFYRALYKEKHSLTPTLSVSDIYSFDKDFQSEATIQGTDPLQIDLSIPYRYFFATKNHQWTLSLTPGYQHLYMSLGQSTRDLIFTSAYLRTALSTSHIQNLYTDYKLDYSNDVSNIEVTSPVDDLSAQKISICLSNSYFLDQTGTRSIFSDIYYIMNTALGDNNTYDKTFINLGYSHPLSEKWISYIKADYFQQDFKDSTTGREDKNISATLGANYIYSSKSTISLSLLYMDNVSSVDYFSYDKFAFTITWGFNSSYF
jgi:tetratricopeptide (TPR) repeat protein